MPLQAADAHYRAQQRQAAATLLAVEQEWLSIGADFDAGWERVGPRMVALLAAGQLGAARDGVKSVDDMLAEQGIDVTPDGTPAVRALSGVSYSLDGFTTGALEPLLYGAVVHARDGDADSLAERLGRGAQFLKVMVPSQVADASRAAASVAVTARPRVGYVRLVNPPCCQRCAVLAGAFYKVATFQRHPRCDCRMVSTTEEYHKDAGYSIGPDDVKDLTIAQRRAIGDGADMNQVINSHRHGARSKDLMTTNEGVTKRGIAGKRLIDASGTEGKVGRYRRSRAQRLTPEGIYKVSATREEALQRLRDNGYLL